MFNFYIKLLTTFQAKVIDKNHNIFRKGPLKERKIISQFFLIK